jgi:DNA polymerase III epsilon subunit-like protein
MKRLFFDIETSPCIGWFWRPGYRVRLNYDNILEQAQIICISYKWEGQDKAYTLTWKDKSDEKLIKDFIGIMSKADEIVGHNGDRFDIPWIRTRAVYHGIDNVPRWKTLDTLKKSRANFKLPTNKLNDIGRYFGLGEKIHNPPGLWQNVCFGDGSRLQEMVEYCEQDVYLLEKVYNKIKGATPYDTHVGVLNGGPKWSCPSCGSKNLIRNGTHVTKTGQQRQKMQCKDCERSYRITTLQYAKFLEHQLKQK